MGLAIATSLMAACGKGDEIITDKAEFEGQSNGVSWDSTGATFDIDGDEAISKQELRKANPELLATSFIAHLEGGTLQQVNQALAEIESDKKQADAYDAYDAYDGG
jgi:hypothetical protein